jgi:hypothetical protein
MGPPCLPSGQTGHIAIGQVTSVLFTMNAKYQALKIKLIMQYNMLLMYCGSFSMMLTTLYIFFSRTAGPSMDEYLQTQYFPRLAATICFFPVQQRRNVVKLKPYFTGSLESYPLAFSIVCGQLAWHCIRGCGQWPFTIMHICILLGLIISWIYLSFLQIGILYY